MGWYMDSEYTTPVVFPLTISSDITIYANFYSHKDAFKKARNNTIGDDVAGYEYDYSLVVTAGYMSLNLSGQTEGNSKYKAQTSDISFYDEHVNSGVLFYDGTKYQFKKGRELHNVSLDENEVVKKYTIDEVGDDYKFDSSSFAKAIFEYGDDSKLEVTPTAKANDYILKTSFNFSQAVSLVGNYVNHPMVEKLIGELPETSVKTDMHVSFNNDKLNSYSYSMAIDVSGIKFDLQYALTFKNVGVAPTINPKVFNDTYVSASDVATMKGEINGILNTYKKLEHSGYEYKAKTAVDYAKKNAINTTVQGFTKRKVDGNKVYFLNDYEVDSDLKNADLYKSIGLEDCHGGRAKLSNDEVHDIQKKLLGGYKDLGTISNYQEEAVDNYYLFDVLGMIHNISFIQKITNTKKNTVTYSIGSDTPSSINILKCFNDALRINAIKEASQDVKAFGTFSDSSVIVKEFKFEIVTTDGVFTSINMVMNGKLKTAYEGSRDFKTAQDAGFKLELSLEANSKGDSYEPASSVNKI